MNGRKPWEKIPLTLLSASLLIVVAYQGWTIRGIDEKRATDLSSMEETLRLEGITLRVGDTIPTVALQAGTEEVFTLDELAKEYELLYFFSHECPICREIAPIVIQESKNRAGAWISVQGDSETTAYIDSLDVANVWMPYSDSSAGSTFPFLPGVPVVIEVGSGSATVRTFAVGKGKILYLLEQLAGVGG